MRPRRLAWHLLEGAANGEGMNAKRGKGSRTDKGKLHHDRVRVQKKSDTEQLDPVTPSRHISQDWMGGFVIHPEAVDPAIVARSELSAYSNAHVHAIWDATFAALELWAVEHGEAPEGYLGTAPLENVRHPTLKNQQDPVAQRFEAIKSHEPWEFGGAMVRDTVDLLEALIARPTGYPKRLFSETPPREIVAAATLFELARGDTWAGVEANLLEGPSGLACNQHLIAAIKGRRVLEVMNMDAIIRWAVGQLRANAPRLQTVKELLATGRKQGAKKRKMNAAKNSQALWKAAEHYFWGNPSRDYAECARALLNAAEYPNLREFLVVNKNTKRLMTEGTLIKKISGSREAALQAIGKEHQP